MIWNAENGQKSVKKIDKVELVRYNDSEYCTKLSTDGGTEF